MYFLAGSQKVTYDKFKKTGEFEEIKIGKVCESKLRHR